ncbi:hypothetical protein [Streptomyces sp. uw30]|uniref:hypothetical protein n=1 Tax=Streptomyces sp. uw30 TaxID=1828179 RepID=UPI0011CE49D0|nr:hypothetical protein [Streptomyces sp. uw30]
MGPPLDARALVDGSDTPKAIEKVRNAAAAADVDPSHTVVIAELDNPPETADIEDLFSTKDYLCLYNRATGSNLTEADPLATNSPRS